MALALFQAEFEEQCNFIPTMLGQTIRIENECDGRITNETEDAIYIESSFFTGWLYKIEYWNLLGLEDEPDDDEFGS